MRERSLAYRWPFQRVLDGPLRRQFLSLRVCFLERFLAEPVPDGGEVALMVVSESGRSRRADRFPQSRRGAEEPGCPTGLVLVHARHPLQAPGDPPLILLVLYVFEGLLVQGACCVSVSLIEDRISKGRGHLADPPPISEATHDLLGLFEPQTRRRVVPLAERCHSHDAGRLGDAGPVSDFPEHLEGLFEPGARRCVVTLEGGRTARQVDRMRDAPPIVDLPG